MGKGAGSGGESFSSGSGFKARTISKEELGRHRTPDDAWMSYKVIDLIRQEFNFYLLIKVSLM